MQDSNAVPGVNLDTMCEMSDLKRKLKSTELCLRETHQELVSAQVTMLFVHSH